MSVALLALALHGAQAASLDSRAPAPLLAAQDPGGSDPGTSASTGTRMEAAKERKVFFEVNVRGRNMSLPRGMLNIWFTPSDEVDSRVVNALGEERARRPDVQGWAYGVEFAFKDKRAAGILWLDWVVSNLQEGYWDDADNDPLDGDYIKPGNNLGILMFGVDYAYEVPFVKPEQTKGIFGLGLNVGAGLGLGVLVGQYERWEETEGGVPSYRLYLDGEPPNSAQGLPSLYPVINFNLGLKFTFAERVHFRLEGGLHTLLYYGAAVGMSF